MNRRLWPLVVLATTAALSTSLVHAQTPSPTPAASPRFYVGGSLGRSDFGSCPSFASCDTKDLGFRLYGGYQFHPMFSVELGYAGLGETSASVGGSSGTIKASGWTAQAVGSYPVMNRLALFGKLGAIYGETKVGGAFGSRKDTGTNLAYGVGVRYGLTSALDLTAEWERFRFDGPSGKDNADLLSAGIRIKF